LGNCGGILSNGPLTIVGSTITENSSDVGGGVCGGTSTLILESSITANEAQFGGGGGIIAPFLTSGSLLVQNSTIARNTAKGTSGVATSQGTFINSTIADNVSDPGPGAGIGAGGAGVTVVNTIVARNQTLSASGTASVPSDCAGKLTSFGNNLIGDPTGCTITLLPSDLTGDHGLGGFKDNGRPGNGHFPLSPTSQAVDAGNDAMCPRVDQLGRQRIGPCDVGAIRFEKGGK
jgi:hypothetical protein